ncbi:hypothetical protein [Paracoccus sp. ME4]|uniref:hypothetical protein n=1 Tax=Paracoccus sp. ME4 TaxID=3138066 RepID=UPI00398A8EEB
MPDAVPAMDAETVAVRDMAHFILAFIEGHSSGYLACIHAATIVLTSMSVEQADPTATLDELLAEMRAEGLAMIEVMSSGAVHDA